MLVCTEKYIYLGFDEGVNSNNQRYLALNVLEFNTKNKLSFVTKNGICINEIKDLKLKDFQEIEVDIQFHRMFNAEKRTSYWTPELIGIKPLDSFVV